MALEKVRTLSMLTIQFATDDITDKQGGVIPKGTFKAAHLEYTTYITEDGKPIKGTYNRETATATDLNSIPDVGSKLADSLVRMAGQKQVAEQEVIDLRKAHRDELANLRQAHRDEIAAIRAERVAVP